MPTVLIVDDHPSFRATARLLLEADGFTVVGEAETGTAAVRAAEQLRPDVVLLDVNLPDLDGYAVCEALRRVDKEVPVVFITGQRDLKDYHSGRHAGGDSYLVKPISAAALRSTVHLFTTLSRKPEGSEPRG